MKGDRRIDPAATAVSLRALAAGRRFKTILADPPWRFDNAGGRVAPETARLFKYPTMAVADIAALPVEACADTPGHLYLWVPNALLPEGLRVVEAWGYKYVTNLVWMKTTADGDLHHGGMGWYFRNATELILFGTRGKSPRTLDPARSQANLIEAPRGAHSQKPDEFYDLIERCSPGPYLELFARRPRAGWAQWGNEMTNSDNVDFDALFQEHGELHEQRGRLLSDLAVLDNCLQGVTSRLSSAVAALALRAAAPPPAVASTNGGGGTQVLFGDVVPVATVTSEAVKPRAKPAPTREAKSPAKKAGPADAVVKVVEALGRLGGKASKDAILEASGLTALALRGGLGGAVRGHRIERLTDGTYTLLIGG